MPFGDRTGLPIRQSRPLRQVSVIYPFSTFLGLLLSFSET